MNNKSLALLVVDNLERLPFFLRVSQSLINHQTMFVVYKASVAYKLKSLGYTNYKFIKSKYTLPASDLYKDSFEIRIGLLTHDSLNRIANGINEYMCKLLDQIGSQIAFTIVWNGNFIHERAICDVASRRAPIIYFELANIEGKLQMDNRGVNASSSLYSDPSMVNSLPMPSPEYLAWKRSYITKKLDFHQVKQSNNKKKLNLWTALDVCFDLIVGKPILRVNYFKKLTAFLKNRKSSRLFTEQKYDEGNYLFFPMQVKNDTQCILNSDYSVDQALRKAYEIALTENSILVVKPHPAEIDIIFIEMIVDKYKDRVVFSNENTFRLIKNAKKVITINSSVGIEAKLMDKEVITLGRSFFSNFTNEELDRVIDSFFVNIDYFSDTPINKGYLEKIFESRYSIN